jgi:transcriptional regulator with XRE-family HTH domain
MELPNGDGFKPVEVFRPRSLRAARGWSQERLAEEAGIHRTYLGGIETARRNPSLRNLIRLARALGVPIADLFEDRAASPVAFKR